MIGGTGRWCRAALAAGAVASLSATAMAWTEFGCFVDGPTASCAAPLGDVCPALVLTLTECGSSSTAPDGVGGHNARKHVVEKCVIQRYRYDPVLGCVDDGQTVYTMTCVERTGDTCVGGGGSS